MSKGCISLTCSKCTAVVPNSQASICAAELCPQGFSLLVIASYLSSFNIKIVLQLGWSYVSLLIFFFLSWDGFFLFLHPPFPGTSLTVHPPTTSSVFRTSAALFIRFFYSQFLTFYLRQMCCGNEDNHWIFTILYFERLETERKWKWD